MEDEKCVGRFYYLEKGSHVVDVVNNIFHIDGY